MKNLPICLLLNQYYFLKVMEMYIVVFNEQHALTTDSKRELNKTELVDLLKTFLVITEADKSDVFFKKLNIDNRVVVENEILLQLDKKKPLRNPILNNFVFNSEEMNERETSESSSSESGSDSDSSSGSDSDSDF